MQKRGEIIHQALIYLILVGLIFGLFIAATTGKINGRGVKQQVVEKQLALLIDAAVPGMSFKVQRRQQSGTIDDLAVKEGKVFAKVSGLNSLDGYPYFTRYRVEVTKNPLFFEVKVA
jgi:hypothetical protein